MLNEFQNKFSFYSLCYANKKIKVNGEILEAIAGQSNCHNILLEQIYLFTWIYSEKGLFATLREFKS
jgi:hypothetical protein